MVLARVRQLSGPTKTSGAELHAEATITQPSDGQLQLRLVIRAGNLVGVRNIDGKSCKDLAGATAVALALLLSSEAPLSERELAGPLTNENPTSGVDPSTTEHTNPANARSSPVTPAAPAAPPPQQPRDSEVSGNEAAPSRRWRALAVLPLGVFSVGPLRQPSLGLGLAAGGSFERWRVLAQGTLWSPQRATMTNLRDAYSANLERFSINLRGCRNASHGRFELAPCLTVSLQHLSARGSGPDVVPQSRAATWIAAGAGLRVGVLVAPWLRWVGEIDAELETSRPEVEISGLGSFERLLPAAAIVSIGPEWIL